MVVEGPLTLRRSCNKTNVKLSNTNSVFLGFSLLKVARKCHVLPSSANLLVSYTSPNVPSPRIADNYLFNCFMVSLRDLRPQN